MAVAVAAMAGAEAPAGAEAEVKEQHAQAQAHAEVQARVGWQPYLIAILLAGGAFVLGLAAVLAYRQGWRLKFRRQSAVQAAIATKTGIAGITSLNRDALVDIKSPRARVGPYPSPRPPPATLHDESSSKAATHTKAPEATVYI